MNPLKKWYARKMDAWENELAFRSTNRVVRPFEWGTEWIAQWPEAQRIPLNGHDPETYIREMNIAAIRNSEEFFSYEPVRDFEFEGEFVRYTSAAR